MKITQIREKDGVEALSVLDFNLLIEKIKTEIKTRPVTGLPRAVCFGKRNTSEKMGFCSHEIIWN